MNIIILADKYQKRMKSRGCVGLIKYNNKNILSHQYKIFKGIFPNANIVYIYGFDHKRLVSYLNKNIFDYQNVKFIYNSDYDQYNNVYSLNLAKEYLNDDCILLFGDHIVKPSTFENFQITKQSQVFINLKIQTRLGCIVANNSISNICYDLDNYLSEIYFISQNQISTLKEFVSNPNYYNSFIFEILNKMIDSNHSFIPLITNQKVKI